MPFLIPPLILLYNHYDYDNNIVNDYLCMFTLIPFHSPVATEDFLQVWNIVLIVIGVVAFVLGDAVAAGLGVYLALKSTKTTGEFSCLVVFVVAMLRNVSRLLLFHCLVSL